MLKEDNEAINCSMRNEMLIAIFMDLVPNSNLRILFAHLN